MFWIYRIKEEIALRDRELLYALCSFEKIEMKVNGKTLYMMDIYL